MAYNKMNMGVCIYLVILTLLKAARSFLGAGLSAWLFIILLLCFIVREMVTWSMRD